MKKSIKSVEGMTIGTIETGSDGREVARSVAGMTVGEYDPLTDRTTTPTGGTVSYGNILAALFGKGERDD